MVDSVFFPFQSQQEKLVPEFSRSVVSSPPSFLLGEEMDFQKKKKKKMLLGGMTNFPQRGGWCKEPGRDFCIAGE